MLGDGAQNGRVGQERQHPAATTAVFAHQHVDLEGSCFILHLMQSKRRERPLVSSDVRSQGPQSPRAIDDSRARTTSRPAARRESRGCAVAGTGRCPVPRYPDRMEGRGAGHLSDQSNQYRRRSTCFLTTLPTDRLTVRS